MMKSIMAKALATAALMAFTTVAQAQEKVIWWDFLGGGDGVRMKTLIEDFNKEHARTRSKSRRPRSTGACRSTPRCRPRPPSAKALTS